MSMIEITVKLPAHIAFKAQGVEGSVDVAKEIHAESFGDVFTYGVRRWIQDNVNSAANSAAKAGVENFDAKACVADRLKQLATGETRTRGTGAPGLDPVTAKAVLLFKHDHVTELPAYKAIDAKKQADRALFAFKVWEAQSDATRDAYKAKAEAVIAAEKATPKVEINLDGLV